MTELSSVDQFLSQKKLALAGVSRSGRKFGNAILKHLISSGYEVSLVHPEAVEIDGHRCYRSLTDLPEQVGGLVAVVPPAQTEKIVKEAAASGIRNIWMQQGAESSEAVKYCQENGINEVHGECIMMFAQPRGLHRFHRWLWGLLGKLPEQSS